MIVYCPNCANDPIALIPSSSSRWLRGVGSGVWLKEVVLYFHFGVGIELFPSILKEEWKDLLNLLSLFSHRIVWEKGGEVDLFLPFSSSFFFFFISLYNPPGKEYNEACIEQDTELKVARLSLENFGFSTTTTTTRITAFMKTEKRETKLSIVEDKKKNNKRTIVCSERLSLKTNPN